MQQDVATMAAAPGEMGPQLNRMPVCKWYHTCSQLPGASPHHRQPLAAPAGRCCWCRESWAPPGQRAAAGWSPQEPRCACSHAACCGESAAAAAVAHSVRNVGKTLLIGRPAAPGRFFCSACWRPGGLAGTSAGRQRPGRRGSSGSRSSGNSSSTKRQHAAAAAAALKEGTESWCMGTCRCDLICAMDGTDGCPMRLYTCRWGRVRVAVKFGHFSQMGSQMDSTSCQCMLALSKPPAWPPAWACTPPGRQPAPQPPGKIAPWPGPRSAARPSHGGGRRPARPAAPFPPHPAFCRLLLCLKVSLAAPLPGCRSIGAGYSSMESWGRLAQNFRPEAQFRWIGRPRPQ